MIQNDIRLPRPIIDAMNANKYSAGKADYTASSLVYGAKEYWGRKKFAGELHERASRLWAAFTGTLMHLGLESLLDKWNESNDGKEKYVLEDRITISFNENSMYYYLTEDRLIGGAVDCRLVLENGTGILYDYKTMSTAGLITKDKIDDWTKKANLYRWLMECTGKKIGKLIYIPIFKDWTATKADRSAKVEDVPCPEIELEMWTREQIEKWIFNSVSEIEKHKDTPYEDIPYCNEEQRWEKPKQYKVCKVKNGEMGNALPGLTFDNEDLAKEAMETRQLSAKKDEEYAIKITGGEATKCQSWCGLSYNGKCNYNKGVE